MDLLDELSISDVRTTAQDTLIKECEDGMSTVDGKHNKKCHFVLKFQESEDK